MFNGIEIDVYEIILNKIFCTISKFQSIITTKISYKRCVRFILAEI